MRHHGSTLPRGWERDPEFADRIYDRIDQMIADGAETSVIAAEVGCSYRTVHRYRERGRPKPSPNRGGHIPDEEVRSLLQEGWSGYAILTEYGVNYRRTKRIRDELGHES